MTRTHPHLISLGSSFCCWTRPPAPLLPPHWPFSHELPLSPFFASAVPPHRLDRIRRHISQHPPHASNPRHSFFSSQSEPQFEPQIQGVTDDADLITSGNDLGYTRSMMSDVMESTWAGGLVARAVMGERIVGASEDEVAKRIEDVIEGIQTRAPKATIILVEYMTIIGPDTRPNTPESPFSAEQLKAYKNQARRLQRAYERAARGKERVRLIHVAKESLGLGLGSEEPWVSGWSWSAFYGGEVAFHPNAKGMEVVARMIYDDLKGAGLA